MAAKYREREMKRDEGTHAEWCVCAMREVEGSVL